MRWVSYSSPAGGLRCGVLAGDAVHGGPIGRSLQDLLASGPETMAAAGRSLLERPEEVVPLTEVRLEAPIARPPAIRDFMAFENHAATSARAMGVELNPRWYEIPVFYFTNPAAVKGPRADIPIAPGSQAFDYELEVAAVIGIEGSDIPVDEASRHIAGYLLVSDWSARDLQRDEMVVGLGPVKGKDTATSLGPWLITPDELADVRTETGFDLSMTATVNGEIYSSGSWADVSWSFEQMISYASRGTTLVPGDVIGSGTVGTGCILELSLVHGGDKYPWLRPGDHVVLDVDRLGAIESTIVATSPPHPLGVLRRSA